MKNLTENISGYAEGSGFGQALEYPGALGPVDAETVQGKDRLNAQTPEGLHRINTFIDGFFKKVTLNPQYEVAQLKSRLNHINFDFEFDSQKPLDPINHFVVTTGTEVFGVTPTTDLSVGFDSGEDLPKYDLEIRVMPVNGGFKLEGKMTQGSTPMGMQEESVDINIVKRNKRIALVREMLEKNKAEQVRYSGLSRPSYESSKPMPKNKNKK